MIRFDGVAGDEIDPAKTEDALYRPNKCGPDGCQVDVDRLLGEKAAREKLDRWLWEHGFDIDAPGSTTREQGV